MTSSVKPSPAPQVNLIPLFLCILGLLQTELDHNTYQIVWTASDA